MTNNDATARLRQLVAELSAADLARELGGGWTIGFALAHLAFWDARQVAALRRFASGDGFPAEDMAANATLALIADAFNPATIGAVAVRAAEQLDAAVEALSAAQLDALRRDGLAYAVERSAHRDEHMQQIEAALS